MTDQQLPLLPPHRNHGLFADHYLDDALPRRPEWARLRSEAAPLLSEVARIFAAYVPSADEAQTEAELIRPILTALGHTFEVQARLQTPGRIHRPDYVLYRDEAAKAAHKNLVLGKTLSQEGGLAIADAKYWRRPLDSQLRDGSADGNQNPAFQLYWYMLHSGVEWGILTNGKLWRLVHRDTADRLDVYYEVDLPELAQSGDTDRFLFFYAFFRRAAFDPGPLGLAEMLSESIKRARRIGEGLKSQVYDALRHISQGFLDYKPNGLNAEPETLKAIHDNSLILLYRLIFILYSEARDLLPIRESDLYRDTYSLLAIKKAIARDLAIGRLLLATSTRIWPQLKDLFGYINRGEKPLNIGTYNGGLFDPAKYPFLEHYIVSDAHLQQAIDKLARVDGNFIDYRDLAVRHIGTIYEGLLEYHLQPLEENEVATEPGWTIALVNDKGERKATGSYYTPDYVVKFMVDRAVGPALREAVEGKTSDDDRMRAVFQVNVLDPAMGSGHFLVEAVDYIGRFLVDLGAAPVGKTPDEADMTYWKRRVVQSCIYGVDLNPLAVELAKLSLWLITVAKDRPLSFLDHHLRPGNSLVGTRLTVLQENGATATAKRRRRARTAPNGQKVLFTEAEFTRQMAVAVGSMWLIEENDADSVDQVKEQERIYAEIRRQLIGKYGKLADLLTARYFGVDVPADLWTATVDFVTGRALGAPTAIKDLVARAVTLAENERFFHWELEFPEVFFDRHGRPLEKDGGFEVVIGNPPYIRQEGLAPYKPYLEAEYPEVYHGMGDIFVFFFAQGLRQARRNGRLSYISSNSWLRANYATPLRHRLQTTTTVEMLIDLGDNHVFEGAPDIYPAINVVRKALPPACYLAQVAVFNRGEGVQPFETKTAAELFPVSMHDQPDSGWQLSGSASRRIFTKLMAAGKTLGKVVNEKMYYGIKTGLNKAFVINQATRDRLVAEDPGCITLLKKMLRGEDLRPWYQEDEGRWLIALPSGWTRATFGKGLTEDDAWHQFSRQHPSVTAHLLPFADAARVRYDQGEYWWELRPCSYYGEFEHPKIMWPDIAKFPRYSWDDTGACVNDKGYILLPEGPYILGILQTRATWFCIANLCVTLGERTGWLRYQQKEQFISRLPIPEVATADREVIGTLAMTITDHARARYTLHQRVRHRLQVDLGALEISLNQKLTAWWELGFPALRAEVKRTFKHDIPLAARDEWEAWHAGNRAEHDRLTAEIIRLETELNTRVYALYNLTPEEIVIIEKSTKYRYGEV